MKAIIITLCLIGAAFANPILVSTELDSNSTESLSVSESAENNTSEIQSSEENVSNHSSESESESVESASEDTTSEESDSQSDEDDRMDSMPETQDDSMGSQENVRKQSWVSVYPNVAKALSAEDNTSTESHETNKKHPVTHKTGQGHTNQALLDTTSDSADISAAASNSSESASSESHESNETSSESTEDSNGSDSNELQQIRTKECVNGTQSCESEENFQSIGDDAHFSVDNLTVPDEDDRELRLRR
ncbi:secretory calcium-binding phosphoprotein 1 [Austrofundulus limnaeus]|uniref:Secretory calcium-binding phosphoprotein 1 n=1 Tax=Austrofundulus limnaeus TaxID=52670 RepID=A0A2I4B6G8_AUSLI|nr:PREDICTED: dentin sialophosphoprotein-like [Austrofundulus limnaeus]